MIRTNNRVALYARFSSDNQRSESIDAQIRAMKAYCKQHNFVIVDTYVDEAKSATTDKRPAFQQMISDSANHGFDILLVHKSWLILYPSKSLLPALFRNLLSGTPNASKQLLKNRLIDLASFSVYAMSFTVLHFPIFPLLSFFLYSFIISQLQKKSTTIRKK